jgi:hypothetical protein
MKIQFDPRLAGWLLAVLLLALAEAHAASGFTVTTSQEDAVAIGMTTSQVQEALGRPARVAKYRISPGPIWTYRVIAPLFGKTEFNVEFGADDRVIAKSEYVVGNEAPNGGRD